MQVQELLREFKYNSVVLTDPNSTFSLAQVRDFYSSVYPDILNAEIEGPDAKGNKNVYTFRRAVGTKGTNQRDSAPQSVLAPIVFHTSGNVNCLTEDHGNRRFWPISLEQENLALIRPNVPLSQLILDLAALLHINWLDDSDVSFVKTQHERICSGNVYAPNDQDVVRINELHRKYRQDPRQAA
jgi:PRTRC genetic system protein C